MPGLKANEKTCIAAAAGAAAGCLSAAQLSRGIATTARSIGVIGRTWRTAVIHATYNRNPTFSQ